LVGGLRHRITFRQKVSTPDGSGGTTFTWQDYYTCSASVKPTTGTRLLADDQTNLIGSSTFLIRENPDVTITQDMILVFGGEDYTLAMPPVVIEEKGRWVKIIAKKKI
jgi:SPP1 family predicted phage head-tail adaptor